MARKDKLRDRFLSSPPPQDFNWDDLVALLEGLQFTLHNRGGSRRCFSGCFDGIERSISLHEPHPSGIVKRYVIREVSKMLKEWGLI